MVVQNSTSSVPSTGAAGAAGAASGSASRTQAVLKHLWERRVIYSVISFVVFILLAVVYYKYSQFT